MPAVTPSSSSDSLWRFRWWLLASGVVCLAALGVLKLETATGWRWPLFLWGLALGVAGAAYTYVFLGFAARGSMSEADQRVKIRRRRIVYSEAWLLGGLELGTMAGISGLAWVDIVVTAYFVVVAVGGVVVLTVIKRRPQT